MSSHHFASYVMFTTHCPHALLKSIRLIFYCLKALFFSLKLLLLLLAVDVFAVVNIVSLAVCGDMHI